MAPPGRRKSMTVKPKNPDLQFIVKGKRPSTALAVPGGASNTAPSSRDTAPREAPIAITNAFIPKSPALSETRPQRKIALDIVLGHPAWQSPLDVTSSGAIESSPQSPAADGDDKDASHFRVKKTEAKSSGAISIFSRISSKSGDIGVPGDLESEDVDEEERACIVGTRNRDGDIEIERNERQEVLDGGLLSDDQTCHSDTMSEEDRYDAIELLDMYEDEEEDRAVEAFELAASAAIQADSSFGRGTEEMKALQGKGRSQQMRFKTQEPLLVRGVQGKEMRRPASSMGTVDAAIEYGQRRFGNGNLKSSQDGGPVSSSQRQQPAFALRRPKSAIGELMQIKRETQGLSPELQRILARARAGRGFGLHSIEAGRLGVSDPQAVGPGAVNHAEHTDLAPKSSWTKQRPISASIIKTSPEEHWTSGDSESIEDVAQKRAASRRPSSATAAVGASRRRLALVSPLASAAPTLANVSFGKERWKTRAAGGGSLGRSQQRPSSAFVGPSRLRSLQGSRPKSALAAAQEFGKEVELGISLHVSAEVQSQIEAMPQGGGERQAIGDEAVGNVSDAKLAPKARETFVSIDTGGLLDIDDPVPPNHRVVEIYDHPTKLHEIYLVPYRKPAVREDAIEVLKWLQVEWAKFHKHAGWKEDTAEGRANDVQEQGERQQSGGEMDTREYVKKGNTLLSLGFHEILRQVYMYCNERGRALEHVWRLHLRLTDIAFQYADRKKEACARLQAAFKKGYQCEEDVERDVQARVKEALRNERAEFEQNMCRARTHGQELVYRLVGLEQMIERLTIKYEKTKKICRELTAKITVMRDMLNDAEEGFSVFLTNNETKLNTHSSWSRRPEKELQRQRAYLQGRREYPKDILQGLSTEKLAAWETMHDSVFHYLHETEELRMGFDAQTEFYSRQLAAELHEKAELSESLARMKALSSLVYGGEILVSTATQCNLRVHAPSDEEQEDQTIEEDQTNHLRQLFDQMDEDKSGMLSFEKFATGMSRLDLGLSSKGLRHDVTAAAPVLSPQTLTQKCLFKGTREKIGIWQYVKEPKEKIRGAVNVMSLRQLLTIIDEIYEEKVKADKIDDREDNARATPHEFCYDFLLTKFGLKSLADKKVVEIVASVEYWSKSSLAVRHFGQFQGVCADEEFLGCLPNNQFGDPCGVLNFYLDALETLKTSKHGRKISERDLSSGQQLISRYRLKKDVPGFVALFGDWDIAAQILLPCTLSTNDTDFDPVKCVPDAPANQQRERHAHANDLSADIDLDLVLDKVIQMAKIHEEQLFHGMIGRFQAADTDGNGVMSFEEFHAFASSLSRTAVKPKKLKNMFRDMVEDSVGTGMEDCISPAIFVRHAIRNNLIDPTLRRYKSSAPASPTQASTSSPPGNIPVQAGSPAALTGKGKPKEKTDVKSGIALSRLKASQELDTEHDSTPDPDKGLEIFLTEMKMGSITSP